jgi:hypothetical protein
VVDGVVIFLQRLTRSFNSQRYRIPEKNEGIGQIADAMHKSEVAADLVSLLEALDRFRTATLS